MLNYFSLISLCLFFFFPLKVVSYLRYLLFCKLANCKEIRNKSFYFQENLILTFIFFLHNKCGLSSLRAKHMCDQKCISVPDKAVL